MLILEIFSNLQYTWIGRKWTDKKHLEEEQKKNSIYINKTIEIKRDEYEKEQVLKLKNILKINGISIRP